MRDWMMSFLQLGMNMTAPGSFNRLASDSRQLLHAWSPRCSASAAIRLIAYVSERA